MTPEKFIKYVKKELKKDKIRLLMIKRKNTTIDGIKCTGYFDEENSKLVCCIKNTIWLSIMVHEYSHVTQSREQCKAYLGCFINNEDRSDEFIEWISGKKYHSKRIYDIMKRIRFSELDCDKRAVKIIKKFKLPIDINTYIQASNAYAYFHTYAFLKRKWWDGDKVPYGIKEVYSQMPTKFMKNYDNVPQKYIELYDKFC